MIQRTGCCSDEPMSSWLGQDSDVVEVPLLLPGWQVSILEQAAHLRGQTAAEMVRSLLRDFIEQLNQPEATELLSFQFEDTRPR